MRKTIRFEYAAYMLPRSGKDPGAVLRNAVAKNFPGLQVTDALPDEPKAMIVHGYLRKDVDSKYPPPNLKSLKYDGYGLTAEQGSALQQSKEAFVLDFAHPSENVWEALRNANALVEMVAIETGGLVWDEETREVFSPQEWHRRRLANSAEPVPNMQTQTVIHAYQNGEYVRSITLGMAKAGLPDVVVEESPWSRDNQAANLINIFCQAMAEGQALAIPGKFELKLTMIRNAARRAEQLKGLNENATGIAYLSLSKGKREKGDAHNRLIQLSAERYDGPDSQAKQEKLFSCLFGASQDPVTYVKHDEALLEESRKERAKLPELRQAFERGLLPGEYIQLKAPFDTPEGGREWMWVEVTSWEGGKIKGLLENEAANIPELHTGQVVGIREDEVFDYLRHYPDKHQEGNTTGEVIARMEEAENKRTHPFGPGGIAFVEKVGVAGCEPK